MKKIKLLLVFISILISSCVSQPPPKKIIPPTQNPYEDCFPWYDAKKHTGQKVCVYGRVLSLENENDDASGQNISTILFSTNISSLFVREIGGWFDENYLNQCIIVRGYLRMTTPEIISQRPVIMSRRDISDKNNYATLESSPPGFCN